MKNISFKVYAFLVVSALPFVGLAQNDQGLVKCGNPVANGGQATACTINDFFQLFVTIFNYLLGMGAVVAFAFLIYGAIQMFIASVDPDDQKLSGAKATITQALIGLGIVLLAYVLVNTLLTVLGITNPADYFNGNKLKGTGA